MEVTWAAGALLGLLCMASLFACAPLTPNKVKLGDELKAQTGLLGYWNFDETSRGTAVSGSDFADLSGGLHGASAIGALTLGTQGVSQSSITSNGAGAVSIPIDLSHEKVVTISLWVNASPVNANTQNVLFEYTPDSSVHNGFLASLDDSSGSPAHALLLWLHSASGYFAQSTSNLVPGWHNFVAIFDHSDASQNSIAFYLDGSLTSMNHFGATAQSSNSAFDQSYLYLLCRGGTSNCLRAQLDELLIWNRAMTPLEIQSFISI